MTPTARLWREERIAEWSAKAARRRNGGRRVDLAIADCLDGICTRLRMELEAAAPTVAQAVPTVGTAFDIKTLFSAPASVRHRRSAAVCHRIGEPAAAETFERLADQCEAEERDARPSSVATAVANRPPPDPVPFVIGPQMDLI